MNKQEKDNLMADLDMRIEAVKNGHWSHSADAARAIAALINAKIKLDQLETKEDE